MKLDTVTAIRAALEAKQVSALELAQDYLQRISAAQQLNAYLDLQPEVTLAQARAADDCRARGEAALLTGVPVAHKDIFVTRDFASTAASQMLAGYRSPFDATAVELLAAQGMVTLGKLNCDEFAMGSTNENSAFGAVKNPWDESAIPGGSSGGSAAAVAARIAPVATGTDTGGSIRQPAAHCGITGIKPTYGSVSRWGMIAFASSLDQGGVMAHSAQDAALVLGALAQFDPRDSTSVPEGEQGRPINHGAQISRACDEPLKLQGLKIGVPKEFFGEGLEDEVAQAVRAALQEYEKLGAQLVDISLPNAHLGVAAYYIIAPAEASSNLARFDGVRYGHRAENYTDLIDMMKRSRSEGLGAEPKRRILLGTYLLSHGYYDAYYLQAQKVRRIIANDFQQAFSQCDVIAGPVTPSAAFDLGSKANDPVAMYLSDLYTIPCSLAGLPGMSIPCGFSTKNANGNKRPIGLQLIANAFQEARLLSVAHQFQQETNWHLHEAPV